jgi:hypothetical protein
MALNKKQRLFNININKSDAKLNKVNSNISENNNKNTNEMKESYSTLIDTIKKHIVSILLFIFVCYLLYNLFIHITTDPRCNKDTNYAVFNNKPHCITKTSGVIPDTRNNNFLIGHAAGLCYVEVFKALRDLKGADPSSCNNYAIRHASKNGCVEIVKYLIEDQKVDPNVEDGSPLIHAATNGHTEIVKILLQSNRVTRGHGLAFMFSYMSGYYEIAMLLYDFAFSNKNLNDHYRYARYSDTKGNTCPWIN